MVATNSMANRSSLELMLDKLQQVEDRPEDGPPALPVRPVSRARLPRARKPLQLDSRRKICEQNGWEKTEEVESCHKTERNEDKTELCENLKEIGIPKIQKCYRGHQVRCYYKELRRGTIVLQSFIRGENARRGYGLNKNATIWAIIIIQKQTRNYFKHRLLQDHQSAVLTQLQSGVRGCLDRRRSSDAKNEPKSDQTQVPYSVLVDLEKQVLRSEAKVRGKDEENLALRQRLEEIERKWRSYEERMKSMEKEWQDQFTYIQECLAAKNSRSQNRDAIRINSVYEQREMVNDEGSHLTEVRDEQSCVELHSRDELRKLKHRFKAWKKEYRYKLRDAQSTLKKLGNSESEKRRRWWGRLSH